MRLIILFLLMSSSICFSQNDLPNDLELREFKGKIRRIVVDELNDDPKSQPIKKVLNFDKNGLLKTIAEYNIYYVEDDSVALSGILYYKNIDSKRYFYRYDIEKKDTTMTGYYEKVSENKYLIKTENNSGYKTSRHSYMANGNVVKDDYKVYDKDKIGDITMTYNYHKDELIEISVIDNIDNTKEEQLYNIKSIKDEKGNIINQIYFDQDGNTYLEIKRKIFYYD